MFAGGFKKEIWSAERYFNLYSKISYAKVFKTACLIFFNKQCDIATLITKLKPCDFLRNATQETIIF